MGENKFILFELVECGCFGEDERIVKKKALVILAVGIGFCFGGVLRTNFLNFREIC